MMHRPHSPQLRPVRASFVVTALLALGALAGCANPNFIGIQDYGTIYGNVIDTGNKPIGGALISATGTTGTVRTGGDGSFRLPQVSIGLQTLSISAPGYGQPAAPVTVQVMKDLDASVGNITLPSTTSAPPR